MKERHFLVPRTLRGLVAGAIFATVFGTALVGCEQDRAPEVNEFPNGFHGWAVIVWNVPGYPQLPMDHGKRIEHFSADGVIITSSTEQFGFAHDEAYFLDAAGRHLASMPNIPVASVGRIEEGGHSMDYFQEFVGTEAELETASKEAPQLSTLFSRLYKVIPSSIDK